MPGLGSMITNFIELISDSVGPKERPIYELLNIKQVKRFCLLIQQEDSLTSYCFVIKKKTLCFTSYKPLINTNSYPFQLIFSFQVLKELEIIWNIVKSTNIFNSPCVEGIQSPLEGQAVVEAYKMIEEDLGSAVMVFI